MTWSKGTLSSEPRSNLLWNCRVEIRSPGLYLKKDVEKVWACDVGLPAVREDRRIAPATPPGVVLGILRRLGLLLGVGILIRLPRGEIVLEIPREKKLEKFADFDPKLELGLRGVQIGMCDEPVLKQVGYQQEYAQQESFLKRVRCDSVEGGKKFLACEGDVLRERNLYTVLGIL